jgi:KamA family protein
MSDNYLKIVLEKFANIPHIKRIRFHSRLPIVLPERITEDFIHLCTSTRLQPVMVVHANHPNEINEEIIVTLTKMQAAKIVLLNQSVLLKNINDDAKTLIALSEKLFSAGVLPYYLHLLDKVQGTAHFLVAEAEAKNIYAELTEKLSGYLVPKLVYEQAGAKSKCLVV